MTTLTEAVRGVDRLFAQRAGEGQRAGDDQRAGEGRAPSASYGVFTPEGLVHAGSTGSVAGTHPTADTVYRIASCTKSFTATAVLALRDAGSLHLDDPVTAYVPAFEAVRLPAADAPVPTIRMLLTMSAGLPTDDPWGDRQESITDEALDALLETGLSFDSLPGTRFAYSNLGYALLGRVVTVASGRPYRDVVTGSILEPLGLASTGFVRPEGADDRLAVGHRRLDGEWQPLPFSGPGGFSPIGGLFSTVTDLSRWARWLSSAWAEGREGDLDGILSRASRRELQQMHRYVPAVSKATGEPSAYGFGLFVEEQADLGTVVSHSGGYPGFSAHMRWHAASGIGMVAFENATYAQVSVPTASTLHALLRDVDAAPRATVWPETRVAQATVDAVIRGADVPAGLLSENVDLDVPLGHRRTAWAEAIDAVGGLAEQPLPAGPVAGPDEHTSAPSHLVWRIPGAHGRLRVEIRLTPEATPRVQTLGVRVER